MAQLPSGHDNSRAGNFPNPSPSPGPSSSSAAAPAAPNGSHANHTRSSMTLPGGYPYQTTMGPPQPGMRRPSIVGQNAGSSANSPQQKPMPYAYTAHAGFEAGGASEPGYQFSPSGSYSHHQQQQQWNNAAPSSPAIWAPAPSTGYAGHTFHSPQAGSGPQQGEGEGGSSSNGQSVSVSSHRPSQPSTPVPSSMAPSPYPHSRAPSRTASFAAPEASSNTAAAAASWGGAQTPQPAHHPSNSIRDGPQDAKQVMDVLGGSGIDLRAEEEAMRGRDLQQQGGHGNDTQSQRSTQIGSNTAHYTANQEQQPPISSLPYLQLYPLASFVHAIASTHEIGVEPDVLSTLSTGARIRFRNLMENMIASSRQRCWSSHERLPPLHQPGEDDLAETSSSKKRKPMYHQELISDPSKWVTAIEKADRGEEIRARRRRAQRQREAMLAAAASDSTAQGGSALPVGVDGEGDELMAIVGEAGLPSPGAEAAGGKKKGKAVSAKNISEDVRRRLANNTAARALGGATTPKWMLMGTGSSAASSGFSTPTRTKGDGVKADESADGAENSTPVPAFGSSTGGLNSLPKPRFGPASSTGSPWARGLAPSGLAGTPLGVTPAGGDSATGMGSAASKVNPQGWGDLAARALAKEEEEKRKRKRVNLQDVYHAVETERRSGIGSGAGEKTVWRWRCLGPEAARKSAPAAGSGSGTTGTGTSK